MIDERAGASSADPVHPLLDRAFEIGDFGVLAAQFDRGIGKGHDIADRCGCGDDLLDKRQPQGVGKADAGRTGQHDRHQLLRQDAVRFADDTLQRSRDVGKMPRILLKNNTAVFIQHNQFDGGGTDIDAYPKTTCHCLPHTPVFVLA